MSPAMASSSYHAPGGADSEANSPASPTSPSSSNPPSRQGHQHRPSQPSNLRQTQLASPDESRSHPDFASDGIHSQDHEPAASTSADTDAPRQGGNADEPEEEPDARTSLLHAFKKPYRNSDDTGGQGAMSPRPRHSRLYGSFASSYADTDSGSFEQHRPSLGGRHPTNINTQSANLVDEYVPEAITDGLLGRPKRTGTTHWLAKRAGITNERMMYVYYYIPITNWIRQYRWKFFRGDLIAAITMASFYIPMALSYASNLAHMPPINGMYAFVFNPFFYAILGTCPQMIVGPEAAGSLLTGSVVAEAIKKGKFADNDGVKAGQVGGMVTGVAGSIILIAGIFRLGFLDSVLSRPFLRGFISSIGLVILINQAIPEMGLESIAEHSEQAHGSPLDTIIFLSKHWRESHLLTCIVSFGAVAVIMVMRELKRRLQPLPKLGWVVFFPDRFVIVVLAAVFSWQFHWHRRGIDIIGDIRPPEGVKIFEPHFPFDQHNFQHVSDAFETGFIIALLGFFESVVAAKSLGSGSVKVEKVQKRHKDGTIEEVEEADGIRGMTVSSNRELVALGVANIVGGFFMALPAFGGYGRSKVNASTGGKSPMSSILLAFITLLCVVFLLPYFYYIPKGVLSAMITVVSISLLEEAPSDIKFFYKVGGYVDLLLMLAVFLSTFFWSLRAGIIVGIVFSLIRLLKHSTKPRIQIMGRIRGTMDFENAEVIAQENVEMIPHCLVVKIPEPLTFANTGTLKHRLKRLEDHGTQSAHPALPSVRSKEHNKNIIFELHGVTGMDYAAVQVFREIIAEYVEQGTAVFFCRLPSRHSQVYQLFERAGVVELIGGQSHVFKSVGQALRATESTSSFPLDLGSGDGSSPTGVESGAEDGVGRRRMRDLNPVGEEERDVGL